MVRDLPLEIIIEIFKYADFRCCMCQKKLLPGGMYRYFPHVKTTGTLVKLKCNFDFKFKNPPRVLS